MGPSYTMGKSQLFPRNICDNDYGRTPRRIAIDVSGETNCNHIGGHQKDPGTLHVQGVVTTFSKSVLNVYFRYNTTSGV